MKRRWKWTAVAVPVVLILIQAVPQDRSNPPTVAEVAAPSEVASILHRACYDCHSHETRWPWYSYVAPVSWLVVGHVTEGREHLNFSEWAAYDSEEREDKLEEIWEEVEEGGMPLRGYRWLHRKARLSQNDRDLIHQWVTNPEATTPNTR